MRTTEFRRAQWAVSFVAMIMLGSMADMRAQAPAKPVTVLQNGPAAAQSAGPQLYVGLRRSSYGERAHNADDSWWITRAKEYASNFPGAKPCIIEIVGNYKGVATELGFVRPASYTGPTNHMLFQPGGIDHERALSLYDNQGVCAVLQFEPGDADVLDCIEAAHQAFGRHKSVIGYGIDAEWYRTTHSGKGQEGLPIPDEMARAWTEKTTSLNRDYTFFIKHFTTRNLPPTFRHEKLWFLDDSQEFPDREAFISEFKDWGRYCGASMVGYQFGYPHDRLWWSQIPQPPLTLGAEILKEIPSCGFVFWVDFSAAQVSFVPDPVRKTAGLGEGVNPHAIIRGKAGDSEIIITTTARLAGAIDSLTWRGKQFINSADHGRQLQTAWNADAGIAPIQDETFNPTEAGSRDDGAGPHSSSRLLRLRAAGNVLESLTQPAFWLAPDEKSGGNLARNKTILSDHLLARRVVIGYKDLPHAIDYHVAITLPAAEHNKHCVIEALTGYMPPDFTRFQAYNTQTGGLEDLDDGPAEQRHPLVFSTADGQYAMGVYSPGAETPRGETGPTYGRWRFKAEKVVKWNCVYRVSDTAGLQGDFNYRVFVVVGTRDEVKSTLAALVAEFSPAQRR